MKKPIFEWQCKNCGDCCKNLIEDNEPDSGIGLFPWEIQYFPKQNIEPFLGFGPSKDEIKVLQYSMKSGKVCPNYTTFGCKIYNDRPLLCRTYPFVFDPKHGCQKLLSCKNIPDDFYDGKIIMPESDAGKLMPYYMKEHITKFSMNIMMMLRLSNWYFKNGTWHMKGSNE